MYLELIEFLVYLELIELLVFLVLIEFLVFLELIEFLAFLELIEFLAFLGFRPYMQRPLLSLQGQWSQENTMLSLIRRADLSAFLLGWIVSQFRSAARCYKAQKHSQRGARSLGWRSQYLPALIHIEGSIPMEF